MERLLTNAYNEELNSNRDLDDDVEIDDVATDENGDIIENFDGPNESKCSIFVSYIQAIEADKFSCFNDNNYNTNNIPFFVHLFRRFLLR